jgi:hypothetical protein
MRLLYHHRMEAQQHEIKIEIDDATAQGLYANAAFITHSETEFLMDLAFIQPQAPKTKVLARVITSPLHAKRLLWALKDNIDKYEARFGPIGGGPQAPLPHGPADGEVLQ